MKKSFFILVFFVLTIFTAPSIFAQAVIPNGCFGVNYGDTPTKVKEIMAKRGCVKGDNSPDENQVILYHTCTLAGYPCSVSFGFIDKKMYEVNILYSSKGYDTWIAVYKDIAAKYGAGQTATIGNSVMTVWADEKNGLVLKIDGDNLVWLLYRNGKLSEEADERRKNEY